MLSILTWKSNKSYCDNFLKNNLNDVQAHEKESET